MLSQSESVLISRVSRSLIHVQNLLFGQPLFQSSDGQPELSFVLAQVEGIETSLEKLMPRVYGQMNALKSKSERTVYNLMTHSSIDMSSFAKVLDMNKSVDAAKEMNSVRSSLEYLVQLENLKIRASKEVPKETNGQEIASNHKCGMDEKLKIAGELMVLHKLFDLEATDHLPLQEMLTGDHHYSAEKVIELDPAELTGRFLDPVIERSQILQLQEAFEQAKLGQFSLETFLEFENQVKSVGEAHIFVPKREIEGSLERYHEELMRLFTGQTELCNQALKLPPSQLPPLELRPWPDSLSSFTANVHERVCRLHSSILSLTHSHTSAESELHSTKVSISMLKHILKSRETDLETLGEDYYNFATQVVVPLNEGNKRLSVITGTQRSSVFPTAQKSAFSREVSEMLTDARSPLTAHVSIMPGEEEGITLQLLEPKRDTFLESIQKSDNLEKFLLALHLDSERQDENRLIALRLWSQLAQSSQLVKFMSQSELEHVTLEGFLKAKLLKSNPIVSFLASGGLILDEHMPAYELFPILFQTLDSAFELGYLGKSFPEVALEYLSATLPVKSKIHQFLGTLFLSLQTFYMDGDPYAVFFARMLRVFHPDPLLDAAAHALLMINAAINSMTQKKSKVLSVHMTDNETGGNVFLVSALESAFMLPLSTDLKLFEHFLTCIKPEELSDFEWAALVIACKAEYLMIDLTAVSPTELQDHLHYLKDALNLEAVALWIPSDPLSPDEIAQLFNCWVYTEIKDLLFLPKGKVLDAYLQVYDLYVESLVSAVTNTSSSATVTRYKLDEFLRELDSSITEEECGMIWETAVNMSGEDATFPTIDGIHLAIITSDILAVSIKPLLMREVDIQLKHTRAMSFDYRHGRLSACFSDGDRAHTRQKTSQRKRFGDRRVTRLLSRPDSSF